MIRVTQGRLSVLAPSLQGRKARHHSRPTSPIVPPDTRAVNQAKPSPVFLCSPALARNLRMSDGRPDPDELLKRLEDEEQRAARGRLKVFFGASAGVGKTYAMLTAAHQQRGQGVDVVVGLVESDGHRETRLVLEGLWKRIGQHDRLSRRPSLLPGGLRSPRTLVGIPGVCLASGARGRAVTRPVRPACFLSTG